jgi:transcriptional regulator with XRE-family HTH domain
MSAKEDLILTSFAENVVSIRQKKGLSLSEVAANCQLQRSKVSLIESGRVNVTLMTIIELAEGLGVSPKQLLDFEY